MSVWFISLLLQGTLALPEVERLPELSSAGSTGPNWVRGAPEPTLIWMERGRAKAVILQESVWREGGWSPKTAQAQSNKAFVNWADFPQAAVSLQGNSLYATLELLDYPHLSYGVRLNTESENPGYWHQSPNNAVGQWQNPNTGNSGTITPTQTYTASNGAPCREFTQTIYVGGYPEQGYGTACRQADGSWQIVQR